MGRERNRGGEIERESGKRERKREREREREREKRRDARIWDAAFM